ncbi:TetR/AcrR family transcriptional regulator [Pseudogracilibacillus auburnensis]|uniref:TetR/AcrR family transcriptional regulator n=1 Tax=Pseudogracilibacillus auburnensis TaxID=1494959 RepID=UPI001A961507|nr:TetR/AcrR family transcriptional regulator [Pseudogracilibacillus auburnensis]MBO1005359.1 TetR/AcrR family transcriptional regulator [Pseudogracilibacillus auburnensis]
MDRKTDLTRERIMDVARDLLVEKGYRNVSMRQIASEMTCSHGAIYYHFKNKAELFYALVEDHFSLLDKRMDEILEEQTENKDKLKKLLLGFIEFGLNYQSHYEIMFLIKDKEVLHFLNENPTKTYEKFANAIAQLSEKQLSIQEIWSIFLSLHGFVSHYLRHIVGFTEVEEMAKFHVKMVIKWAEV